MNLRKIIENSDSFTKIVNSELIPLRKRIIAKLVGYAFLGYFKPRNFRNYTRFYVIYCRKHKVYYIDYEHGYNGYLNPCSICLINS